MTLPFKLGVVPLEIASAATLTTVLAFTVNPFVGALGLSVLSAVLGLLSAWYWFQRNQAVKERDRIATEHQKLVDRVTEIETQSHVLAQAMLPVSAAFQAILIKELTHMHTPEMDLLMTKLGPPFVLTETEADRLAALLEARTRDMGDEITASERDAASMMPALIRRVRAEAAADLTTLASTLGPKLVALTAVVEAADGKQKAMLIATSLATSSEDQDHHDRRVLAEAIAENTRLTQETLDLAKKERR
jgi:hypothetical protein